MTDTTLKASRLCESWQAFAAGMVAREIRRSEDVRRSNGPILTTFRKAAAVGCERIEATILGRGIVVAATNERRRERTATTVTRLRVVSSMREGGWCVTARATTSLRRRVWSAVVRSVYRGRRAGVKGPSAQLHAGEARLAGRGPQSCGGVKRRRNERYGVRVLSRCFK